MVDSIFIENHSRYSSNCISFVGFSLKINNSTFINCSGIFDNSIILLFLSGITGLPDPAELNPEIGGSVSFHGAILEVNRSCFMGSTGFKGGAIYVDAYELPLTQNVLIVESYFKGNKGNVGGAVAFSIGLKWINAVINACIFISNLGKSIYI